MQLPEELVLLRHGQSVGNAASAASRSRDNSLYTPAFGIKDPYQWELTSMGESQARKAGVWMRENNVTDFDLNLHSSMLRAKQTALISTNNSVPFQETHLLSERNWGALISSTHKERKEELGIRDEDPYNWLPPGGESMSHVEQRLHLLLSHLSVFGSRQNRVRMVCHGEVMWGFQTMFENISPGCYKQLHHDRKSPYRLYNCHLLHYRNLQNGIYREKYSVCTYNTKRCDSGWQSINTLEPV